MNRIRFCCVAVAFLATMSALAADDRTPPSIQELAIEKWADKRMPVTSGLMIWLDASKLSDAQQAGGRNPLQSGDPVEIWPDASGHQRDLVQKQTKSQPLFRPSGDFQAVYFDANERHLRRSGLGLALKEMTIFIVSATYSNPDAFSAWLSMSESGSNDYETGLNIDQGVGNPPAMQVVNVEGAGNGGMINLLQGSIPYGHITRMCVSSTRGKAGTALWINGKQHAARDRAENSVIQLDEFVLGARRYTHGGTPEPRGFLHADVAEVLVFDRSLSKDERIAIDKYLEAKYGGLAPQPVPGLSQGKPLERVATPPIQVLLPGFSVQQLPIDLANLNNILYRPDGKLLALGYDGTVWLLSDTDNDGLEDQATIYWDSKGQIRAPIVMDLTPPGYSLGNGVFVASKGKCSLLLDSDNDDRADKEIIVAQGWKELPHGVDALGIAVDLKDGSVVFGLGTTDFTNAYLIGADGKAAYDLQGERGTILRVAPDFKSREIVCTGIRFPVGLRFNRAGDLFCTDQEGATWLSNGNPFDELLQIQKGRHYGFPPRHPRHLPNVIDEPSTSEYDPQHQSTCGFCFNDSVTKGGPTFGPKEWAGDAFVTGYSRGKLYRTQLVKTQTGYVARNSLFACISMMPVDCCVTPDGGLLVACHSGGPDWGSGPNRRGALFKIRYTDRDHPQPVLAWAAGPRELRIEFDRAVNPTMLKDSLNDTDITAGAFVRAGDRFESLWPGYSVVQMQHRSQRRDVKVYSAQLTADHRTLVLATDPMLANVHYAVTLPGMGRPLAKDTASGLLPQLPQIDLDFDLTGLQARWIQNNKTVWSGWLPSFDLNTSQHWTAGSATHDLLWSAMRESGTLTLTTELNLIDMLRPNVQIGSRIDYEWPPEDVSLTFASTSPSHLKSLDESEASSKVEVTGSTVRTTPQRGELIAVELQLSPTTLRDALSLNASYSTAEDRTARPLLPQRSFLPWVRIGDEVDTTALAARPKELEGGSWSRGWKLFHDKQNGCAKCHAVQGQGSKIGPDLSNLIHRDYTSVMRDVTQPGFAINPDYLASIISLNDGRVLTGVVRTLDGKLHVTDTNGKTTVLAPADVEEMKPSAVSIMPDGLLKNFSSEQSRDLLTYLLTTGPSMPRENPGVPRPSPRTIAEVNAVLSDAPSAPQQWRPLRVVLVAGPKDHGPGEHDYPAWLKAWNELLSIGRNVDVITAMGWPGKSEFDTADVMVFYQRGEWNAERAADIDRYLGRGGGLVYVHFAVDGQQDAPGFAKRIALSWGPGAKFRHGPLQLHFNHAPEHPVSRGFTVLKMVDESYWNLTGQLAQERVVSWGDEENKPQPLFWSLEQGQGRVFVSIPGHYSWSFDDPLFRVLLLRGMAWTAKEPVDRFNDLVWPGADVVK